MTGGEADTATDPAFTAAFDFSRALRDPALRDELRRIGYVGQPVIPVVDGTPWSSIVGRVCEPGRHLIVQPDGEQPHGWRIAWMEVVT